MSDIILTEEKYNEQTKDNVKQFLRDFHQKKNIFQILFRDERGKNSQALLDLEITSKEREQIIDQLKYEDYIEGPLPDKLYGSPRRASMWVFGKVVKEKNV